MFLRTASVVAVPLLALALVACERSEAPEPVVSEPRPEPVAAEPAPVPEPCRLTMGWDAWEPYHFEDVDGEVRGMEIDLVNLIASGADCEVSFQRGEWTQLVRALSSGEIDLLSSATVTPERESFAHFSDSYRDESFRLFVRRDEAEQFSEDSLAALLDGGMRLGVTLGYVYGDEVTELQDDPAREEQFIEHAESEFNFFALAENNVDGVLEDPYVATAVLRRRGWQEDISMHSLDLGSSAVSLMFSRESVDEETVQRFNRSLSELKDSGEVARIIERYRMQ